MRPRPRPLMLAVLGCLGLGPVLAADGHAMDPSSACNRVELGLGTVQGGTPAWGALRGEPEGDVALLDLFLCRALDARAGDGRSAELMLSGAGLRGRNLQARIGTQGRYRLWAQQHTMPAPRTRASTVFTREAGGRYVLPPGWVAGSSTAQLAALLPSLGPVDLGVDRRRAVLGGALWLGPEWSVDSRYSEQRRDGLRGFAALVGNSGGNPRVAFLPEPVAHRTRDVDLALRYVGTGWQWRGGLLMSRFDNLYDAVRWQNPFAGVAGWHPAASHPLGEGQASLAPDNRFVQLSSSAAWSLSPRTRLNLDLATGRLTQDQAFLPYTVNPVLAATITEPLPRDSLDGRVDIHTLHVRLVSRPGNGWDWLAAWRYDERDNRTRRDAWVGIGGDSQAQEAGASSARRRFNLPVGHRDQRLRLEGGYRSGQRWNARLALEHREIDRTWSARAENRETQAQLVVRARPTQTLELGTRLLHADRGGSAYLGSRPFADSHAPAYVDTVPGGFQNLPGLRQYHLADRQRRRGSVFVHWAPDPHWQLGITRSSARDDYTRSEFGLQSSRIDDTVLDLAFMPDGANTFTAFAARERLAFDQAGRAFMGGANRLPQAGDPDRDWSAAHDDRIDGIGLGWRRTLGQGRLQTGLDAARTRVIGNVDVRTGAALASAPLPATRSSIHSLDADARLRVGPNGTLRLRWRYERVRGTDWSTDGVGPGQLANVVLLGEPTPDYSIHALMLSWIQAF